MLILFICFQARSRYYHNLQIDVGNLFVFEKLEATQTAADA